MRILVIGAGVVGLSCAIRLAEAGYRVDVLARDLPAETTSAVAAALWYPYHAAPEDQVAEWSLAAYAEFVRIAEAETSAGVRVRTGTELLRRPAPPPSWSSRVPGFEILSDPTPGHAAGWRFPAPVIDMGSYLPWLVDRLERLGGTVTRHALSALPNRADLVVNTSGLGARRLAGDMSVTPVRGQVVVVRQVGLTSWWLDAHEAQPGRFTYVVPRLNEIVIGGTSEPNVWDLSPDPANAGLILRDAARLVPQLADATVLRHRAGLRPVRPAVRLETEVGSGGHSIVHCYGHGGSGVTMSWGCADDVLAAVRTVEAAGAPSAVDR